MKKYLFSIAFSLLTLQFINAAAAGGAGGGGGAAAASFLDGFEADMITARTFAPMVAPFSVFVEVGEAEWGIENVGDVHAAAINAMKEEKITQLRTTTGTFTSQSDDFVESFEWLRHEVSPRDLLIAKALYLILSDEKPDGSKVNGTYVAIEKAVWNKLPPLLGFSIKPAEVELKQGAEMDLWVFLCAMRQRAFPDYPFAERLKKPTVASSPCGDMHILADRFKVLVSAYQAAGTL